jgi:hypothetical protein
MTRAFTTKRSNLLSYEGTKRAGDFYLSINTHDMRSSAVKKAFSNYKAAPIKLVKVDYESGLQDDNGVEVFVTSTILKQDILTTVPYGLIMDDKNDKSANYFAWAPTSAEKEQAELRQVLQDVGNSSEDESSSGEDGRIPGPAPKITCGSKRSAQPGPKVSGKKSKTVPVIGQPSITGFTVTRTPEDLFDAFDAMKAEGDARRAEEKVEKEARRTQKKSDLKKMHDEMMEEIKLGKDEIIAKLQDKLNEKDAIIAKKDEDNANLCHDLWKAHGKMGAYRNEAGKETREENERLRMEFERIFADNAELHRCNRDYRKQINRLARLCK